MVLSMTRLRDWGLLLICNLIWVSQFVLVKIVQDQAGDKLYLAVVNRNESAEVVSSIRVSGWSPGRGRSSTENVDLRERSLATSGPLFVDRFHAHSGRCSRLRGSGDRAPKGP